MVPGGKGEWSLKWQYEGTDCPPPPPKKKKKKGGGGRKRQKNKMKGPKNGLVFVDGFSDTAI